MIFLSKGVLSKPVTFYLAHFYFSLNLAKNLNSLEWPVCFVLSFGLDLFLREIQKVCMHVVGEGQREGDRDSQAGSVLSAQSPKRASMLNVTNCEIMT